MRKTDENHVGKLNTQRLWKMTAYMTVDHGGTVVKVLCYKSESRWFDPSWCHWNFSLTYNPSDRNTQYQEHFLGIKAAGA